MESSSTEPEHDGARKLEYARPGTANDGNYRQSRVVGAIVKTVVWVGIIALVLSIVLPLTKAPSDRNGRQIQCLSHLRQIGIAIALYANENKDACPPDLGSLCDERAFIIPDSFICPSSTDAPPAGTRDASAVKSNPSCCSYLYLGAGKLRSKLPPNFILAYERNVNHKNGLNMLFVDGRVECVEPKKSLAMLRELQAGFNPPRASVVGP